jgi:hypothetical protein
MGQASRGDCQNLGGVVNAMSLLRNITTGLRALIGKKRIDREFNEELSTYLEMAAEEKMKRGMNRKEALRAVRLERGNLAGRTSALACARSAKVLASPQLRFSRSPSALGRIRQCSAW